MPQAQSEDCWWASAAMLFRHRLAQNHHIRRPQTIDPIFEERQGAERTRDELMVGDPRTGVTAGLELRRRGYLREDRFGRTPQNFLPPTGLRFTRGFLHPSHWYRLGIPADQAHVAYLAHLIRASPVRRFADGVSASPHAWVEAIRHGPFMLVLRVGEGGAVAGSYAYYHFVVVQKVTADMRANECTVRLLDPARGPREVSSSELARQAAHLEMNGWVALRYRGGHAQPMTRPPAASQR